MDFLPEGKFLPEKLLTIYPNEYKTGENERDIVMLKIVFLYLWVEIVGSRGDILYRMKNKLKIQELWKERL